MSELALMTIEEITRRHPRTIGVFVKHGMLCPGCPTEAFHTVAEAARIHGLALGVFVAELRTAVADRPHEV